MAENCSWTEDDTEAFVRDLLADNDVVSSLKRTIWDIVHPEVDNLDVIESATDDAESMEPGDEQDAVFEEIDQKVNYICGQVCAAIYDKIGIK